MVPAQMAPAQWHSPGQIAQCAQPWPAPPLHSGPPAIAQEEADEDGEASAESAEPGKKKKKKKKKKQAKKQKKKKGKRKSTGKSSSSSSESSSSSSKQQQSEDDDDSEVADVKGIGKCFQRIGFQFRNSYPRKRRWSIVKRILGQRLNPVLHSTLSTKGLDQILFIGAQLAPHACMSDLKAVGARKVGTLKDMLVKQAEESPAAQAALDKLMPNMQNLGEVALQQGWEKEWDSKYTQKDQKATGAKSPDKNEFAQSAEMAQTKLKMQQMENALKAGAAPLESQCSPGPRRG